MEVLGKEMVSKEMLKKAQSIGKEMEDYIQIKYFGTIANSLTNRNKIIENINKLLPKDSYCKHDIDRCIKYLKYKKGIDCSCATEENIVTQNFDQHIFFKLYLKLDGQGIEVELFDDDDGYEIDEEIKGKLIKEMKFKESQTKSNTLVMETTDKFKEVIDGRIDTLKKLKNIAEYSPCKSNNGYLKMEDYEIVNLEKLEVKLSPIVEDDKVKRYTGVIDFEYQKYVSDNVGKIILDKLKNNDNNFRFEVGVCDPNGNTEVYNIENAKLSNDCISSVGIIKLIDLDGDVKTSVAKISAFFELEDIQ